MTNPDAVSVTAGDWILVAENVLTGTITVKGNSADKLRYDYRLTGEAAPTTQATALEFEGLQLALQVSAAIDVYVYNGGDNDTEVVVAL